MLRYSGTEPKARRLIEGPQQAVLEKWSKDICDAILDYAVRQDEHFRQIDESDRIDDKTAFIIKYS